MVLHLAEIYHFHKLQVLMIFKNHRTTHFYGAAVTGDDTKCISKYLLFFMKIIQNHIHIIF